MGTQDERIALIIETQAKLEQLRAAIAGTKEFGAAAGAANKQAMGASNATGLLADKGKQLRQGANAMTSLAFAAEQSALGGRNAVMAFGNLATTLAMVSSSAKFAAMASGIGAVVIVATALVAIFQKMNEVTKEEAAALQALNLAQATQKMREMKEQMQEMGESQSFFGRRGPLQWIIEQFDRDRQKLENRMALLEPRLAALRTSAAEKAETERQQQQERFFEMDEKLRTERLRIMSRMDMTETERHKEDSADRLAEDISAIQKLTTVTLADRKLLQEQAMAAHRARMQQIDEEAGAQQRAFDISLDVQQDPDDFDARIRQIELEKEARIKAGRDKESAERESIMKIRAMEQARIKEGLAGFARMTTAIRGYSGYAANAARSIGDAIRKFEILVQAKRDAVLAKSEFAAGLKSLGNHDYWGATQHFAASAGFAAAAVAGGAEAIGGGGGGGPGGGGGGPQGGFDSGTFQPATGRGGATVNLELHTSNPYGREAIQRVIWETDRAEVLKVPVFPTNAFSAVGSVG